MKIFARCSTTVVTFALFGLFASCSDVQVRTEQSAKIDLAQYHTYKWLTPEVAKNLGQKAPVQEQAAGVIPRPPSTASGDPFLQEKIQTIVEGDLFKNGYQKLPVGTPAADQLQPDFYVTFSTLTQDKFWVSNWGGVSSGYQYGPVGMYSSPWGYAPTVQEYTEGTIALIFVDAKTGLPAWRGVATGALSGQEHSEKQIASAVDKMMKDLKKSEEKKA